MNELWNNLGGDKNYKFLSLEFQKSILCFKTNIPAVCKLNVTYKMLQEPCGGDLKGNRISAKL